MQRIYNFMQLQNTKLELLGGKCKGVMGSDWQILDEHKDFLTIKAVTKSDQVKTNNLLWY